MALKKRAYICGPLTELPVENQEKAREFYTAIADVCEKVTGERAFVPHEHFDPIKHAFFTPPEVDEAERKQVSKRTSVLIVAAIAPSWGGGIEVEIANKSRIPIIILCNEQKLGHRRISRLLRGNPAVKHIIAYRTKAQAIDKLEHELTLMQRGKRKK